MEINLTSNRALVWVSWYVAKYRSTPQDEGQKQRRQHTEHSVCRLPCFRPSSRAALRHFANYQNAHHFGCITRIQRHHSLSFLSQLRHHRIAHQQVIGTQNEHTRLPIVRWHGVHTWVLSFFHLPDKGGCFGSDPSLVVHSGTPRPRVTVASKHRPGLQSND